MFDENAGLKIDGLPLMKPPYGRITALDMNKGTKLWTVANGDGPRNHPLLKDLNLPPLGNLGRPVALVTKTLLFLGDASNALYGRAGIAGPAKFRAYDKATGQLISQIDLPVGTTGGPMTYMADGKQLIIVLRSEAKATAPAGSLWEFPAEPKSLPHLRPRPARVLLRRRSIWLRPSADRPSFATNALAATPKIWRAESMLLP